MKRLCAFIILILCLLHSSPLWGQWREFLPKISRYSGEIELDSLYDVDEKKSTRRKQKITDTAFRENLNFSVMGHIYHPRFVMYRMTGSAGLQHERFEEKGILGREGAGSLDTNTAEEYELRAIALPRHPYNFEVFTLRDQPLLIRRAGGRTRPVRLQSGAYLRYKKLPWAASFHYITEQNKQQILSSRADTYRFQMSYVKRPSREASRHRNPFTVFLNTEHTVSSFSDGSKNIHDQYSLDNKARFRDAIELATEWNLDKEEQQESNKDLLDFRRLRWTERMGIELPYNFDSGITYRHDADNTATFRSETGEKDKAFSETNQIGASLHHRLYRSLDTVFSASHMVSDSTGGQNKGESYRLRINYTKEIKGGKLLSSYWNGVHINDHSGGPTILSEIHGAKLFDSFLLDNQNIDEGTISVFVRAPDTGTLRELEETVHYLVVKEGTSVKITVVSLPGEIEQLDLDIDFEYEFQASYTTTQSNYRIRTKNYGYSLRLALFGNAVSPFYSHGKSSQDLLEGSFPGELDRITTDTVGLSLRQNPFPVSLSVEYQKVESMINPLQRWLIRTEYRKRPTPTSSLYVKLESEENTYPKGRGSILGSGFSEKVYSGQIAYRVHFPKKNVNLALSGYASKRIGLIDGILYSFSSNLAWHVGKIDLNLGASYVDSKTTAAGETTDIKSTTMYMKLKRKLF